MTHEHPKVAFYAGDVPSREAWAVAKERGWTVSEWSVVRPILERTLPANRRFDEVDTPAGRVLVGGGLAVFQSPHCLTRA